MRLELDQGVLSKRERRVTRDGLCYDEVTNLGIIRPPYFVANYPEYSRPFWEVYPYTGPHARSELEAGSLDQAIHLLVEVTK